MKSETFISYFSFIVLCALLIFMMFMFLRFAIAQFIWAQGIIDELKTILRRI